MRRKERSTSLAQPVAAAHHCKGCADRPQAKEVVHESLRPCIRPTTCISVYAPCGLGIRGPFAALVDLRIRQHPPRRRRAAGDAISLFPRHAEIVAFWQQSGYIAGRLLGCGGRCAPGLCANITAKQQTGPCKSRELEGETGVALPASGCISVYRGGLGTQTGLGRIRSRRSPAAAGMAGSDAHFTLPFGNASGFQP